MTPLTLLFGPWTPDQAIQALPVMQMPFPVTVPVVDCLNVYYQDGSYRSMPAPMASGPALPEAALGCYTWYDNTAGQELVWAATSEGIYTLADGVWSEVPFYNAASVEATPWNSVDTIWGNYVFAVPWAPVVTTLGEAAGSGQLYNGSVVITNPNQYLWEGSSFTPAADINGNTISALTFAPTAGTTGLVLTGSGLSGSYLTKVIFDGYTLLISDASSSSGDSSSWSWGWDNYTFNTTGTYPLILE